jgi:hypothetical protein
LLKRLLLLPRSLWLVQSDLDIRDAEGGIAVRGVYIGEGLSLPYYRRLFGSAAGRSRRTPIWRLRCSLQQARAGCTVVMVELNSLLAFLLPKGGWTADAWVKQETDLTGERYLRRARGIERGWGQKVRRQGYQCRFTHEENGLNKFYREFYVPYLRERHGESASIRRLSELRAAMGSGFLLQVWRGEDWVSGLIASHNGHGRVQVLASAARSIHLLRQGALSATYYFLFQWARQNQFQTVDFCGTRPHLMDGVFQHKSLWAAEPRHDPWHHTEIVFYISAGASVPRVVAQQLVRSDEGFLSIQECLSKEPN